MVAHEHGCTRTVVQIDTQQLSSPGSGSRHIPVDATMAGMASTGPVRSTVLGRPGCGRRTVARVLRAAGVIVASPGEESDVDVYVVAETLKPEDRAALTRPARPCVAVLNKADLTGFGGEGPVAAAAAHCERLGRTIDAPIYPLAALAAVVALERGALAGAMVEALQVLTVEPATLASADGFRNARHRLDRPIRERLLNELDLFGIAHAVVALRGGADVAAVLRRASGVDVVLAAVTRATAPARYQRLAKETASEFCGDDAAVAARMSAAIAVVEAAGMQVDCDDDIDAHLRRAVAWRRYSRGPVSDLQSRCADDIVRGSLRRWERGGGVAEAVG
jgi:hypothetical protein